MDRSNTASLVSLIFALLLFAPESMAALPGRFEVSVQSLTDAIAMKQDNGPDIPLRVRMYGLHGGVNRCMRFYKRNCLQLSAGFGINSAVVESRSSAYLYKDDSAKLYQLFLGLSGRHFFTKSRSLGTLGLEFELRSATYRSPGLHYNIREENLTYQSWIKAQFDFPIDAKTGFFQTFLFSPFNSEFGYRLGASF